MTEKKVFTMPSGEIHPWENWMDECIDNAQIARQLKARLITTMFRWFPDLWYDTIAPKKGGITLHMYQREAMRLQARFKNVYIVLPRGAAKTHGNVLMSIHRCVWFPKIRHSIAAETKEQSAKILKDKWVEVTNQYPALLNEIVGKPQFGNDYACIVFKNGSILDTIANAQTSKGLRRHTMSIEEAARLNKELFDDALNPVVAVGRKTAGLGLEVPSELNGQINFYTTSTYRGCDEHKRSLQMINGMLEHNGDFVFGADWRLPVHYGMQKKSYIQNAKNTYNHVNFAMNFGSEWVGASEDALLNMQLLLDAQQIMCATEKANMPIQVPVNEEDISKATDKDKKKIKYKTIKEDREYVIGVDVAKSKDATANKTVMIVVGFTRNEDNTVKAMYVEHICVPENGGTYESQSIELKRLMKKFPPIAVVVDGQSYGQGFIEAMTQPYIDPETGRKTKRYCTFNPEGSYGTDLVPDGEPLIYELKSTTAIETPIIMKFQNAFEKKQVKMLKPADSMVLPSNLANHSKEINILKASHINTEKLINEVANLKAAKLPSGKLKIEKVTSKLDKDRYAALAYTIYYIEEYESIPTEEFEGSIDAFAGLW